MLSRTVLSVLFALALTLIYLAGSHTAIKTDWTWDTEQEQKTLRLNLDAVAGLMHGDRQPYQALLDYRDRYYGIGFHLLTYPAQQLFFKPVATWLGVSDWSAFLRVKHWATFSTFFASGWLMFLLMRRLTQDDMLAGMTGLGYLLWPYLFGQALLNVKDVPFLFGWLLCLWQALVMLDRQAAGRPVGQWSIGWLALTTGWLMTIRIAGVLIAIPYGLMLLGMWHAAGWRGQVVRPFLKHLAVFMTGCLLCVYLMTPVFWLNPLSQLVDAIWYMSRHPMGILGHCTLTWGTCMPALDLPYSYIPAWLAVKLPLLLWIGYLILPLTLWKQAPNDAAGRVFIRSAGLASLLIPLMLAWSGVTLYNELRQILFLMPLFFMVGVWSISVLSRKAAMVGLLATTGLFVTDLVMSTPYHYVWFNEWSRQIVLHRSFESDYWVQSGTRLSRQLDAFVKVNPVQCVYADVDLIYRGLANKEVVRCARYLSEMSPDSARPFVMMHYTTKGERNYPEHCQEVGREKVSLFMGRSDIVLGKLVYCH